MSKKSFSDRLTPGQVQQVLDALGLPWRRYIRKDGVWTDIPPHETAEIGYSFFNSDLSINIEHGGWQDQYLNGHPDPYVDEVTRGRGDIVQLVSQLNWETLEPRRAIAWITEVCGINNGIRPPDIKRGYKFANEWLTEPDKHYTRVPEDIWKSDLSASSKLVWLAIFSRINKDEIYSFAGTRRLSNDTGLSRPTVLKAITDLKKSGLLIEKSRGKNKAPARFPLVTNSNAINQTMKEQPSNNQSHTGKETLPPLVKKLKGAGKECLPELDPLNKTQVIKPKKLRTKPEISSLAVDYWCTYSDEQKSPLLAFSKSVGIPVNKLPSPQKRHQELFIATFKNTHRLDKHGEYPLLNAMVFCPSRA